MSGNPWDVSGPVVATLPVPNDVIITKIIGDYTERDRKLWMFLVAAVWDDLESQTVHEIKVSKINAVFEAMGGEKNTAWIWESASRLTGTRAYWKTTSADGKRLQGCRRPDERCSCNGRGAGVRRVAFRDSQTAWRGYKKSVPIFTTPYSFYAWTVWQVCGHALYAAGIRCQSENPCPRCRAKPVAAMAQNPRWKNGKVV